MRHRKSGRKLGRNSSHRKAMFRNMATSMIREERIQTTLAKAKELRPIVEKLITLAKRNVDGQSDPAARVAAIRQASKSVHGKDTLYKLFDELGERFVDRPGGYTRIYKMGTRLGDNADMAIIEFVGESDIETDDSATEVAQA